VPKFLLQIMHDLQACIYQLSGEVEYFII